MSKKRNELKEAGFYHSPVWRKLRRLALQRDHYLCQHCLRNGILRSATEVHHIRPVADWPELEAPPIIVASRLPYVAFAQGE